MDFAFPVTPDIRMGFATPVLVRAIPDYNSVNEALKQQILTAKDEDAGADVSNRGGWQSSPTLWDWATPEIEKFKSWLHGSVLRIAALTTQETDLTKVEVEYAAAWANVNTRGAYNDGHVHPDSDWACVYHVGTGELDPGWDRNGKFELHDPRTMANSSHLSNYGFGRSLLIDPEPGKMILFPAWMEHSVHPFYGDGQRISIAVNIKILGGRHAGRA